MRAPVLIAIVLLCSCTPVPEASIESEARIADPASIPQPTGEERRDAMEGFSWIVDQQLAAMPRPGSQRPLDEDLEFLQSMGIELLVSLTEERPPQGALSSRGIEGIHLPVADFTAPTLEQLSEFVTTAEKSMADGRPVGVHCAAGLGRSGTFVAAYLVHQGLPAADAIAEVRRLRPGSVETHEQEERIAEYARALGDSR